MQHLQRRVLAMLLCSAHTVVSPAVSGRILSVGLNQVAYIRLTDRRPSPQGGPREHVRSASTPWLIGSYIE